MALSDKQQTAFNELMGRLAPHLQPDTMTTLQTSFGGSEEAVRLLAEETMMKADYSRQVQATVAERQAAQARQAELAAAQASVAELTTRVQEYDAYLRTNFIERSQFEGLKVERDALNTQLEKVKTDYDLDLPIPGATTMSTQPADNHNGNNSNGAKPPFNYVTDAQLGAATSQLMAVATMTPALIAAISVEHQKLFGEPLADPVSLVKAALAEGRDLETVWTETYKVADKRAELQTQAFNQQVEAKVQEELAKRQSQSVFGGALPLTRMAPSPLLQDINLPPEQRSVTAAPMFRTGTAAASATAAYISGKYRGEKFDLLNGSN